MSRLQLSSGIDLFYTDDGPPSAPTMIFVHGWSCDSHDWSWHLPAFAGMYRTIAMDLRGHGKTTGSEASYAMTDFATDLAELISMLGVATFVGVGHSMGAMILSELAMSQPGTVRGLVLIDPAYGAPDQVAEQARVAIPTMRGPNGFEALRAQIDALEGPRTPDWLRTWHIRRLLGMSQEVAVTAYAELLVTPRAWAARSRSEQRLAGRRCPVLSLYAAARADVCAWEEAFDRQVTTRLIDAGHWLHQEHPDQINRLIQAWVSRLPLST